MKNLVTVFLAVILSSCGSTSKLHNAANAKENLDLSSYNQVIINDFTDGVSKTGNDEYIIGEGKKFADMLANELRAKKSFEKISRNVHSNENAILIDGVVMKCTEGNSALRFLVGFGAGKSQFDAKVYVKDNTTKTVLGNIDASKMSWALGGIIAGSQNVKHHMGSAASTIAEHCSNCKKQPNKK